MVNIKELSDKFMKEGIPFSFMRKQKRAKKTKKNKRTKISI